MKKKRNFGGILIYGIPEYRLSKDIVDKVINNIIDAGININTNVVYGKDITKQSLFNEGYDAIFVAIGTSIQKELNVFGKNLNGVFGANNFLKNINNYKFNKVAVIGGGNVAIDVAMTAQINGAEKVYIVYRRNRELMPANKKEIEEAELIGIEFRFCSNLKKILGEDRVEEIECVNTKIIEDKVYDNENEGFILDVDTVIIAIGSEVDSKCLENDIEINNGLIKINENMMTSLEKVYAGGDATQDKATVCMAIKSGKEAAKNIHKYMQEKMEKVKILS